MSPAQTFAPALVREAAVAGQFYPGTKAELDATVRNFLDHAEAGQDSGPAVVPPAVPKAIIAPHAGYVYSGAVAAAAYALLTPAAATIKRVVLLGPCHRVSVQGLALSGARAFRTPLGDIPVDKDAARQILDFPGVQVFDATHELEHSLEVHLPFLQIVLDDFTLVPLVVGQATPGDVADVLDALWGGPETLIVISTDLSHYLDYDAARSLDGETCRAIEALDATLPPLDALRAYLQIANQAVQPEAVVMSAGLARVAGAGRLFDAHEGYLMAVTQSLLDRAVAEGQIAPVDTAAVAHVHAGLGREFARPAVAEIAEASPKETADAISELILQGLLANG